MFDRILLPVDGSEASERAQQYAQLLADTAGAEIHALFVLETGGLIEDLVDASAADAIESELRETAESTLSEVVAACEADGIAVRTSITSGHPTEAILDYSDANEVDLVVLGAHARGRLSRFLRASVGEHVSQEASIPVLTIRAAGVATPPGIQDILLAIDGSESARHASTYAFELADAFGATVHGLSVIENRFGSSGSLRDLLERERESVLREARIDAAQAEVNFVPVTRAGNPEREIVEYATSQGMDLIVLGTHGRTGLDRFVMGSVASSVVRNADQPVLTVRGPPGE